MDTQKTNQFVQTAMLRMRDCDARGHWKTSSLLRQLQETAEDHSALMGISRSVLIPKGMCWVLYRQSLVRYESMMLGDEITLTTWPSKLSGPFFPRYFTLEKEGRLAGEAATVWVLFDIEKRRILRPNLLPGNYVPDPRESGLPFPGPLEKEETTPAGARSVLYSDLDMNGHMNNARYADWVCDLLEKDGFDYMQINYVQEALPGQEILLAKGEKGLVTGFTPEGKSIFEALAGKAPSRP